MLGNVSDLDLRLIRIFLAIVDAGGVSAAQSTLNVGQSTISTHLATLEARLGFRLCERGRGGFALTPKGKKFANSGRQLLNALNDFSSAARNMDRKLVGALNIGLIGHTPITQNARLSEAIARFRRRDEAVKFSIVVRSPRDLEEQLLNGQIHLALGYFWHRVPSLDYTPLFIERQIACCGRQHPLFSLSGNVSPAEAAEHEWVWRTYPFPEVQLSTSPQNVTAIADNVEAVTILIMSGHHLGYLPEHVAAPYVKQGLLAHLNSSKLKYEINFHVVTRRRGPRNEVLQAFLQDLRSAHKPDTKPSVSPSASASGPAKTIAARTPARQKITFRAS